MTTGQDNRVKRLESALKAPKEAVSDQEDAMPYIMAGLENYPLVKAEIYGLITRLERKGITEDDERTSHILPILDNNPEAKAAVVARLRDARTEHRLRKV